MDINTYKALLSAVEAIEPDIDGIFAYSNATSEEISHYQQGFDAAKQSVFETLLNNYRASAEDD